MSSNETTFRISSPACGMARCWEMPAIAATGIGSASVTARKASTAPTAPFAADTVPPTIHVRR